VNIGSLNLDLKWGELGNVPQIGRYLTSVLHSAQWYSKADWNIAISISAGKSAIISVHRVKFDKIRFSDSGV